MTRTVFIVPGLVGGPESEPLGPLSTGIFGALARMGTVTKISPLLPCETPEWALLGVDPARLPIAGGPLLISAMKLEPPERSVHFQLSLLALTDNKAEFPDQAPSAFECRILAEQFPRLASSNVSPLWWESLEHGLVWEGGSLDLGVAAPSQVIGQSIAGHLPDGDGDRILRQLIDDSVNLLSELEMNRIRIEEGKRPLNLLWPWAFGFRPYVPNLALRRGEVRTFESTSWRLEGLTRLVGDRHGVRQRLSRGIHPNWQEIRAKIHEEVPTVVVIGELETMRRADRLDELAYAIEQCTTELLEPWLIEQPEKKRRLSIIAPGLPNQDGLCLTIDPISSTESKIPFDERALDDRRVQAVSLWEAVEAGLAR